MRERLHRRFNQLRARLVDEPYRTVLPYTMVGLARLRTLDQLVRQIDADGTPGDVVECGTCNGGSAAILARVAVRSPCGRHVWLLDSFAGLPAPTEIDGPGAAEYVGFCRGQMDLVREVLDKVDVPQRSVTIVPGWFRDTLPGLPVERIALLSIDADWYESVLEVLEALWDRVAPGGFVYLDDYGYWDGCRLAWEDFSARRGIQAPLVPIDGIGVYLQKSH